MRYTTAILALCASLPLLAQDFSRSHKRHAGNFTYEPMGNEEVIASWYHYVTSRNEDSLYIVRVFYPETGQITSRTQYADPLFRTKHGTESLWYDNGSPRSVGNFRDGRPDGFWILWNHGGSRDEGTMDAKGRQGLWTYWTRDDEKHGETTWVDDVRHGPYATFDPVGKTWKTGRYEHGKIVSDDEGEPADTITFTIVERMPRWQDCDGPGEARCTDERIMAHLRTHLKYPSFAADMGISGQALFQFIIDKDGRVTDVVALNALCQAIETECRKVIAAMPPWQPGTQRGKAVKVSYNLPFKFTLR